MLGLKLLLWLLGKIPAQIYKQFISGEMEEKYKHRVTLSSEGHNTDFSLG